MVKLINSYTTKIYWQILVVCLIASILLLWNLGEGSLEGWDEGIYSQIAKEMVQTGNWLTPHWGYEPWFEKPPLFMWVTTIFYKLFGISEFWSRAASAFSGIGLLFVTYLVGKLIYNQRS